MKFQIVLPIMLAVMLGGCAEMGTLGGGTTYGQSSGTIQSDRNGTITNLESIHVDKDYKLGVGTAAGAVGGGILGAAVGDSTTATVAGAVLGLAGYAVCCRRSWMLPGMERQL